MENFVKENGKVIVHLSGKMHVDEASLLRDKLLKEMDKGETHFVVDVSKLEFIDSSGLGVLVGIHKKLQTYDEKLTVRGAKGGIKELFELTRLTHVFCFE